MVCAEYFQSQAVVVAKLVDIKSVPKQWPDYFIYKLVTVRRIRGNASPTFELFEGNDSGRAPFDWKVGEQYLLFLDEPSQYTRNLPSIDGCGNSSPLAEAAKTLKKIRAISEFGDRGLISGMVGTDSWTTGVSNVAIRITGNHRTFLAETNAKGRYTKVVPVGVYRVTATKGRMNIPAEPFSYESPSHVVIHPGGCAQVQFSDTQH
ncbi:MAG TPA: carboxypeptidase-like regulatory domain-containing protein [Acidobacteriaceae bacterium]|nr:carboxypeptidase-like regulatory domain-containing protein [Acidobacteriaceae bacterium]